MQMKNKSVLLVVLLVITFTISIININMIIKVTKKIQYLDLQKKLEDESKILSEEYYENSGLEEITNMNSFFTIKLCTEKYFETINMLWYNVDFMMKDDLNKYDDVDKYEFVFNEFKADVLNDILAEKYKKEFKIDKSSIREEINKHFIQDKTIIKKIYKYDMNQEISAFIVEGYNLCENGSNKKNFNIMVLIDINEGTFEVYPEAYITLHNLTNATLNKKINEISDISKITKNNNNTTPFEIITNEKIADYYLDLYKFNVNYNLEMAYEMLDENYKEKKFESLDNFKNYINENKDKLNIRLDKYKVENVNGHKEYICIDQKGNYYIFNPQGKCLNYNLVLDTYTIDLPEFVESYNKANTEGKTALNIQKIVDALNDQDYKYVYNKLAESFKKENFKTLEEFENYAKSTFGIENQLEFGKYVKTNNYSTYTIKLKNNNNQVTKTIIMDLQDGTNFVFSFNID